MNLGRVTTYSFSPLWKQFFSQGTWLGCHLVLLFLEKLFLGATSLKKLLWKSFFCMHGKKGKFEKKKKKTLNLWVEEGKDSNHWIKFFSLKIFSKRKIKALIVVQIHGINKFQKCFSCEALSLNYVEPKLIFNLLLPVNVYFC